MAKPWKVTRSEFADAIRAFLEGRGGPYDWDDFLSGRIEDPVLEELRGKCSELPETHPSGNRRRYCSESGLRWLEQVERELRGAGFEPS